MEPQQIHQIRKIADMVYRRKALICLAVLFTLAGGLGVYLKQPKLYEASALLSYQQQRVNPTAMSPDTQANIRDIVSTLTQLVTSRNNLEQIILREKLYTEALERLPMEDVLIGMRRNINIIPSPRGDTFQVSFTGREPESVARVANALAARFIEENMKYREERAAETTVYTEDELSMAKENLDKREELMSDFKLQHYNEMPEQQATNVARLIALQSQYQNAQTSIQELERTRLLLQEQITVRKQLIETAIAQTVAAGQVALTETDQQRLNRFRAELQGMLGRYTEQHPSVKALQRRIAQLEDSMALKASTRPENEETERRGGRFDDELFDLEMQFKSVGLNISRLNNEMEDIQKLIKQYEQWVEKAPLREAEWSSLTREHAEMRRHYDHLVSQNLQARSALNLERNQKGSQFKIEDQARTPNKPSSPAFPKTMMIALVAGLAMSGGIILLLEMLNTSFRNPRELEESIKDQFEVEMLCAVPHLALKREVVRGRVLSGLSICVIIVLTTSLAGALLHFYRNGQIIL
jgi:polysaccharide biosynthesis transport protein